MLEFNPLGPVARSLVSANRWLKGIKMYRFPWYLTLVSTNHASSNPGLLDQVDQVPMYQVDQVPSQYVTICLPPYIIKWIGLLMSVSLLNRNNRPASTCPLSNLSSVFRPPIKKEIRIREAITQQREKHFTLSYLALKLRYINKAHKQSGVEKFFFQFSLCLLIQL